jgi:transglutaminase-like putative cysteine protease
MVTLTREVVEKYRELSRRLADPSMHSQLRSLFERRYTINELLEWLHKKVKWSKGNIKRHSDPMEIIACGKGRCGEFSILFTALCLAHNHRARLVLDMSDHVWTEIWDNKQKRWIHVDPSEKKIDDPLMYERDWKKNLKEIYAFENGETENVTERYKLIEG